jgi:hypothetical protein
MTRTLAVALASAALTLACVQTALACACCTETAQRAVATVSLRPDKLVQIELMRFAKEAKLYSGAADNEIRGVEEPTTDYDLAVAMQEDRMVFSFRDAKGRPGTLTLMLPQTISIFEVDPRGGEKDGGLGPSLYKEWTLTANAVGDGLFRGVVGPGQRLSLIFHGRGLGCTEASHFTDWGPCRSKGRWRTKSHFSERWSPHLRNPCEATRLLALVAESKGRSCRHIVPQARPQFSTYRAATCNGVSPTDRIGTNRQRVLAP